MTSHTQHGSTLIISLIILIILMLIGVTAMMTSDTAYKLAGNLQFENNAINAGEAVLSEEENALKAGTINYNHADFFAASSVTASSSGLYPAGSAIDPLNTAWNSSDSALATSGTGRYIIELMSTSNVMVGSSATVGGPLSYACNKVNTYRITARGASARGATKYVQSYFSVLTTC